MLDPMKLASATMRTLVCAGAALWEEAMRGARYHEPGSRSAFARRARGPPSRVASARAKM
jgi:hypothetical protein